MDKIKPKFDVCLIARNEEKTLPRLLESLKEFQERGGQIYLLDTGSTDNTATLARESGCMVHEVGDLFRIKIDNETAKKINEKFIIREEEILKDGDSMFDYASARNYIAKFATNDMIATPDCDEIFTRFDIDKINEAITNGAEQLEYQFVFAHDPEGKPLIQFLHSKFYNRKKAKWVGVVHEVLQGEVKRQYLENIKLEHWQNPETNRGGYLKGLAYDCYMNPDNDRNSHYFARELMYNGRLQSAIKEFERHIAMNKWPTESSQSMIHIGECYMSLGNKDEAFKWYVKAFDLEPGRREPLMRLAEYYANNAQPYQTISYVHAALQIPKGNFYANYAPYYDKLPHDLLSWAYGQIYKLPTISILIPNLGREDGLQRCLDSIDRLNYPKELIEVTVLNGEGSVPIKVKRGVEQTNGEYVVFGSNDIEFTPQSLIEAINTNKPFVAFNTGEVLPDEGNICEHFLIKRDLIPSLGGEIFDTEFHHVGCDNLLWAKLKKMGLAYRSDKAIVHHYHFSKTGIMDKIYEKGWSFKDKDRELLKEKLEKI